MKNKKIACANCEIEFQFRLKDYVNKTYERKFCSKNCELLFKKSEIAIIAKKNLELGVLKDETARRAFRKIAEHACSICGLSMWNNEPIPLVVDHIDGDHSNNFITNLRMICCNCDALLPTYKAKNKGNGRSERRKS